MGGGHHGEWKRLGDGSLLTEDADQGLGHILPVKVYGTVLGTLLILTIITVWVAQFDFGAWNAVVALVVASIKALLVSLFFMHLKFEKGLIIMYAIYPLILLFLLIGSTFSDEQEKFHIVPMYGDIVGDAKMNVPAHAGGDHHDAAAHGGEHH